MAASGDQDGLDEVDGDEEENEEEEEDDEDDDEEDKVEEAEENWDGGRWWAELVLLGEFVNGLAFCWWLGFLLAGGGLLIVAVAAAAVVGVGGVDCLGLVRCCCCCRSQILNSESWKQTN